MKCSSFLKQSSKDCASHLPKWRNWQTRMVQVHVPARVWGFESLLRHQSSRISWLYKELAFPLKALRVHSVWCTPQTYAVILTGAERCPFSEFLLSLALYSGSRMTGVSGRQQTP